MFQFIMKVHLQVKISAKMLSNENVSFCLVGHSERRQYFHDKNEIIKLKNL